jgi:hypothetical protein
MSPRLLPEFSDESLRDWEARLYDDMVGGDQNAAELHEEVVRALNERDYWKDSPTTFAILLWAI